MDTVAHKTAHNLDENDLLSGEGSTASETGHRRTHPIALILIVTATSNRAKEGQVLATIC
jgi:hypothetical protein